MPAWSAIKNAGSGKVRLPPTLIVTQPAQFHGSSWLL